MTKHYYFFNVLPIVQREEAKKNYQHKSKNPIPQGFPWWLKGNDNCDISIHIGTTILLFQVYLYLHTYTQMPICLLAYHITIQGYHEMKCTNGQWFQFIEVSRRCRYYIPTWKHRLGMRRIKWNLAIVFAVRVHVVQHLEMWIFFRTWRNARRTTQSTWL